MDCDYCELFPLKCYKKRDNEKDCKFFVKKKPARSRKVPAPPQKEYLTRPSCLKGIAVMIALCLISWVVITACTIHATFKKVEERDLSGQRQYTVSEVASLQSDLMAIEHLDNVFYNRIKYYE